MLLFRDAFCGTGVFFVCVARTAAELKKIHISMVFIHMTAS